MKLYKWIQITTLVVVVFAFIGCDEDFTSIGGEVINNPTNVDLYTSNVKAYSQKINSIQTNSTTGLFLGVDKNPAFGSSIASIVTQASLSSENPGFGDNPELDSVVLNIPYFSTEIADESVETTTYQLDSIYGEGSFKISIFETSYFLNTLDPDTDFTLSQKYYSNQLPAVEQNIIGEALFTDGAFQPSAQVNVDFEPNNDGESDTIVLPPSLRIKLPVDFFKKKVLDNAGTNILLNHGNFNNYLRSLLIKAEANSSEGSQVLLDFSGTSAKISLYYKSDVTVDEEVVRQRDVYNLVLTGNHFNAFENDFNESFLAEINADEENAENLYVKGQEGIMGIVELFPDSTELADLKTRNWLINEANLTFYVNRDLLNGAREPDRIYLFDLDSKNILIDYAFDESYTPSNPYNSIINFSTPLERTEDEEGIQYTLRITQHVSGILEGDIDNVRLGLVVVPNINAVAARDQNGNIFVRNSAIRDSGDIEVAPSVVTLTPLGTVLYGSGATDPEKRLQLRIYYTEY
ncbi:DUF4270 domain-containing protein [Gramella sp. AN32]|uniref:DUF4270 domain-containing protein n=1 Tax=Christiangramia antarctica TaxID=2058158 RepID=A0ABW5WYC4_9FLAO|nr:DUF4270 domain-containing protein [Gramella sp. AN32]MCM4155226.1 DUF4270 domain-containing protein [Gramella sp. AN32]